MNTRISTLINKISGSASKFADEIGVQRSSISHLISGRNKPSADFLQKLLEIYPLVNIEWVLTGKGEMFKSSNDSKNTPPQTLFSEKQQNSEQKPSISSFSKQNTVNVVNSNIEKNAEIEPEKKNIKKISRIVIFYSDHSFEEYKSEQ